MQNNLIKKADLQASPGGVFWLIGDELSAFPFDKEKYPEAFAKSGNTYNHEKLWEAVKPKGCCKPFDYYPRGRVVTAKNGKAVIYMSPHIPEKYIPLIKKAFSLCGEPAVKYDRSEHYKCFLDRE